MSNGASKSHDSSNKNAVALHAEQASRGAPPAAMAQNAWTARRGTAGLVALALALITATVVFGLDDPSERSPVSRQANIETQAEAPPQLETREAQAMSDAVKTPPVSTDLIPPPKAPRGRAQRHTASPTVACVSARECSVANLYRCLDADGEGCTGVGRYYERVRTDPFSSIKWYRKGCELSNKEACAALERVKDAKPTVERIDDTRELPMVAVAPPGPALAIP